VRCFRWLDIIAARKIILQVVKQFRGSKGAAYTRAVQQTSHLTSSSPFGEEANSAGGIKGTEVRIRCIAHMENTWNDTATCVHSKPCSKLSVMYLTSVNTLLVFCQDAAATRSMEGAKDGQESPTASAAAEADLADIQVDMRAFVEAPPIMPQSCSIRTMSSQRECPVISHRLECLV